MKRLIFFLCIIVNLQLSNVFGLDPEEIQKVKETAQTTKDHLVEDQKTLQKMMDQQKGMVDRASEDQRQEEEGKLIQIQDTYNRIQPQINYLSEYLDKVSNKQTITDEDVAEAENDIQNAQMIIQLSEQLKSEFVPSEPTQEAGQEAQAEIEKLSWWDNFKVNIQIAFAQTKAALASFFGNKEAAAAAHKDLIDIYDQLKDYSNKAASVGQLSDLYKKFKDFGNAIQMQATRLNDLNNVDKNEQISIITDIVADLFSLKDAAAKAEPGVGAVSLTEKDRDNVENIKAKINDFLGELGYKINPSAYEVLHIIPAPATVDEIENRYKQLISVAVPPDKDAPLEVQQKWQERLATYDIAMKELLGYRYDKFSDPRIKEEYDKLPIVQQHFEIKPMTDAEKKAFEAQKALGTSQTQAGILDG